MKKYIFIYSVCLISFILLLSGCSNTQNRIQKVFQTKSAADIRTDYTEVLNLLIKFKQKLDTRNPNNFNKRISISIIRNILSAQNVIYVQNNKKFNSYDNYLKLAFDKNIKIQNRNDLLILGIYKLIYEAYDIGNGHQVTALNYDIKKLQTLYYNLNSIKWRIKSVKDEANNYLFLTWQNNWQIELQKKIGNGKKPSWEMIKNLKYIKQKRETIFESSNFEFEVILSKMIYNVKSTLSNVGEEPVDVSIEAMKSLIFLI